MMTSKPAMRAASSADSWLMGRSRPRASKSLRTSPVTWRRMASRVVAAVKSAAAKRAWVAAAMAAATLTFVNSNRGAWAPSLDTETCVRMDRMGS